MSNSQQCYTNSHPRDNSSSYQGTTAARPATQTTTTMHVESKTSVLLQTAKGYVSSTSAPENIAVARLVLDSGSKHSYVTERLRDKLKLPAITQETLTIKVFGDEEGTLQTCDVVQFCIRSPYDERSAYVTAYVVPVLCAPLSDQAISSAVDNYPHLKGLWLADFPAKRNEQLDCDVLIGSNYYWHFLSGRCVRGETGPVALESILGWILSGPVHGDNEMGSTQINLAETHVLKLDVERNKNETTLIDQISKFWDLESIGIKGNEANVYQSFEDEVAFVDGRYQIKLPWKPEHAVLPDNFQLSKKRLLSSFSKLKANPKLLQEYDTIIKDQEQRGIIERVDTKQECEVGKTTYLPHHPVIRQDKTTTKIRVVFDASAKDRSGTSLNSCLYTGPCLLKTVAEIVTRFRLYPIALTSDIEKAFLMISVWPPDRDALRFLWPDDVNAHSAQTVIYRFARVVFGVSCSPFLLNATLKRHIEGYFESHPEVCSRLMSSLYADDVNTGGYTEAEVIELYKISKQIMKDGGFNLRKWLSNSKEVMSEINTREVKEESKPPVYMNITEDDQSFAKTSLKQTEAVDNEGTKVLGLIWDTEADTFIFNFENLTAKTREAPATKRTILGMIAKISDPLGWIAPITPPLRMFLQKLFQANIQWDETISDDLAKEWNSLFSRIDRTQKLIIPRYYFGNVTAKPLEIELFGFCDSSELSYAAVVYAKIKVNGQARTSLVMSKSRVAPLAKLTIPRLELLSALILGRLRITVKASFDPVFNVKIMRCWTDSITALYWIRGDEREWKLFVENRVMEIRNLVSKDLWHHCPGEQNPADLPTRTSHPAKLEQNINWFHGPAWLSMERASWPSHQNNVEPSEDCLAEIKPLAKEHTALLVQVEKHHTISKVVDCERFSSYKTLLRVTAYVIRFVEHCRGIKNEEDLSLKEIQRAENYWIYDMQGTIAKKKLEELQTQIGSFPDENCIIRCKGRLQNSNLTYESKHPILLPKEHYVTKLIVRDCHKRVLHNGVRETLQELRTRFWIVKGRQLVRQLLHKCVLCKRIQGFSYGVPSQGQLPKFRVKEAHAFSSVGIDFAGPLFIREPSGAIKKVYIALFTCGTSRAVHLELVPDLTTKTFLLCFRRFVSRRGTPSIVVTDNAKTFQAFAKTLIRIFKTAEAQNFLIENRVCWKFNLSKAPWWGGFYERLITSVKICLKKCIGNARLSFDELQTILAEIEGVLISRPLTYQYPNDLSMPITPSHLTIGRRVIQLPIGNQSCAEDANFNEGDEEIRKRALHLSKLLSQCWKRWKREYLVNLREQHMHHRRQERSSGISEGDIVIIEDENYKNRSYWKMGRVLSPIVGRDDHVRGARVLLANGQTIERPVQKLYPLEVKASRQENLPAPNTVTPQQRTPRTAAAIARESIKIIDQLENEEID